MKLPYEVPTASTGHSHDAIWKKRRIYTLRGIDIGGHEPVLPPSFPLMDSSEVEFIRLITG